MILNAFRHVMTVLRAQGSRTAASQPFAIGAWRKSLGGGFIVKDYLAGYFKKAP